MVMIINAGSENSGGTLEQAKINANHWYDFMAVYNFDISEIEYKYVEQVRNGFVFEFTHKVTKKSVFLVTHGYTEKQAESFMFPPRVYWNDSSTANPKLEDFETEEYKAIIKYVKKTK